MYRPQTGGSGCGRAAPNPNIARNPVATAINAEHTQRFGLAPRAFA